MTSPRRFTIAGLLVCLTLVLSGCSVPGPVGIRQVDGSVFVSMGCERPDIVSFYVWQFDGEVVDGRSPPRVTVWEIESIDPSGHPLDTVEFGVVPDGFRQLSNPMDVPWNGWRYFVFLNSRHGDYEYDFDSSLSGGFRSTDGLDGWSTEGPDGLTDSEYREYSEPKCQDGGPPSERGSGVPWTLVVAGIAVVLMVGAVLGVVGTILQRRRESNQPTEDRP